MEKINVGQEYKIPGDNNNNTKKPGCNIYNDECAYDGIVQHFRPNVVDQAGQELLHHRGIGVTYKNSPPNKTLYILIKKGRRYICKWGMGNVKKGGEKGDFCGPLFLYGPSTKLQRKCRVKKGESVIRMRELT